MSDNWAFDALYLHFDVLSERFPGIAELAHDPGEPESVKLVAVCRRLVQVPNCVASLRRPAYAIRGSPEFQRRSCFSCESWLINAAFDPGR
jgi:hypothetical protein